MDFQPENLSMYMKIRYVIPDDTAKMPRSALFLAKIASGE
jgi:hypothetical protein